MTDHSESDSPPPNDGPSSEDVYNAMDPLEPYTTGELAEHLDTSKGVIWSRLKNLLTNNKVREKKTGPDLRIWIREPPTYECPNCGYKFQIKVLHPVLSSVRLCPRCGTQIKS